MHSHELRLDADAALELLPNKEVIRSFVVGGGYHRFDVSRTDVVAAIRNAGGATVTCMGAAAALQHQLTVVLDELRTFIETDQLALAQFVRAIGPQQPARLDTSIR